MPNLLYEKWKNTDAVETMIYFLDAVITEFVEKLEELNPSIIRSKYFKIYGRR